MLSPGASPGHLTTYQTENCAQADHIPQGHLPHLAFKTPSLDFPHSAVVKNLPANAGDTGSSPGAGRSHMPWSN